MADNVVVVLPEPEVVVISQPQIQVLNVSQGIRGASLLPHIFTQSTPLAQWTINHNLNRIPSVAIYVDGELVHTDVASSTTQTTLTFSEPTSGTAILL